MKKNFFLPGLDFYDLSNILSAEQASTSIKVDFGFKNRTLLCMY